MLFLFPSFSFLAKFSLVRPGPDTPDGILVIRVSLFDRLLEKPRCVNGAGLANHFRSCMTGLPLDSDQCLPSFR